MADKPSTPSALPLPSTPFSSTANKTKANSILPTSTSSSSSATSHFPTSFSSPFSLFRHHPNPSSANTMAPPSRPPHHQSQPTRHQQSPSSRTTTMAESSSSGKESKKVDINSLMSPPDQILDSFHNGDVIRNTIWVATKNASPPSKEMSTGSAHNAKHPLPMSPPVSPYSKHVSTTSIVVDATPAQPLSDPVLYPDGTTSSPSQPPLFAPTEIEDHQRIVDDHVRARQAAGYFGGPRREEYELALTFRSQVMKLYTSNSKGWLRKERELLKADRRAGAQRYHAIMPAKPKPVLVAAKLPRQRTDRVSKPQHGPGGSAPRPIRSGGIGIGTNGLPGKRSANHTSPTPEPSRRAVAPNREDKDFNSLPDYCPPIDSLPDKPNSLKVEWKGQPIDLSHDPHASMLHPDEVALAGNLRLDCATYLTSKRRIFERRLQCLRTGKEFRKTDAQQACKIDVNKASKLWTAFDKVNWLDSRWVRPFL